MSLVAQCLRGSGPVPRRKSRFRLKARENKSSELRAAHIASVHVSAGPSTLPGKQREERRAEWKTQRRQVIKVPGGAVLRVCKKTKRKLMAHFQLRAGVHSQLRVIASLYVLRIFLTCLVGYCTPGYPSTRTPPAVQPPRALDAAPLPPLPLRVPAQPAAMDMDWAPEAEPEPDPEPEPEPAPAPPTLRPPSARLAARHPPPAAPIGPPMPLDSEDPVMLQQLQVFCKYFAKSDFLIPYNQLQRLLGRPKQNLHYSIKPAFDDPSNQELLAKLQQLGSVNFTVVAPRKPPQAPRSSQEASQAAASEPGPSTPLPAKRSKRTKAEPEVAEPSQPTKGNGKAKGKGKAQGKAAKAKPAPQPGRQPARRVVRAQAASQTGGQSAGSQPAGQGLQRIGESRWRPLELCFWPDQGALPAKGKEYPGLGYKRLRDKPPKAQQQQPAEAQ
ncbi:hypothetical protein QJQ45_006707 [Haematococcus lacustris]|nr:hypothetical protein QJQ45_006707 [Haematococcus lacustris]